MSDLTVYPQWLDLVDEVQPSPTDDDGPVDAWVVTLKGRVGPFSRSKRLRMVRTEMDESTIRFERQELDGREHSAWVLEATVSPPTGDHSDRPPPETEWRSEVAVTLSYGGSMWSGMLDGVLGTAAEQAASKLQAYVRP